MKVKYVPQIQENECAYCCIAMVLSKYGDNSSITRLRQLNEVGRDGTSILKIIELFEDLNFRADAYQIDNLDSIIDIQLPAIAYWNNNHFVVIEKIEKNKIHIIDPNTGKKVMTKEDFAIDFSDIVVEALPTSTFVPQVSGEKNWKVYSDFFKNNTSELIKLVVMSSIFFLSILTIPNYMNFMINYLSEQNVSVSTNVIIGLIAVTFSYGIILYFKNRILIHFSVLLDKDIYKLVIHKIFSVPYSFFEQRTTGDIVFRFNLLTMIRDTVVETISEGLINIGVIILLITYYFFQSVTLGVFLIISIILVFFMLNFLSRKSIEFNQKEIQENSRLQSLQYETIFTMNTIKTADAQGNKKEQVIKQYNKFIEKYEKRSIINGTYGVINNLILTFGPIVILALGYILLSEQSIGKVFALYSVAGILFSSVTSSFNTFLSLQTVDSYLERVNDLLMQEDEKLNSEGLTKELAGKIEIKNLDFCYPGQKKNTLSNINLLIGAGESLAILGETGSGKSTLLKILSTLYPLERSHIFFDGIDMNDYSLIDLRKQIGIIPQEIIVFNKSIMDNITLGSKKFKKNDIIKAAKDANIHEFINQLPMKYETIISEQGANFSGGQRQRIILARAFLRNPKILILDEATSSLDGVTEKEIIETISAKKITRIIITHNRNIVNYVNRVIEIKDGEIITNIEEEM